MFKPTTASQKCSQRKALHPVADCATGMRVVAACFAAGRVVGLAKSALLLAIDDGMRRWGSARGGRRPRPLARGQHRGGRPQASGLAGGSSGREEITAKANQSAASDVYRGVGLAQ